MKEYTTLGALEKEKYDALMRLIDNADAILAKLNEEPVEEPVEEEKPKTTRKTTRK